MLATGVTDMPTTETSLEFAQAEIVTALMMWREGSNASEVLQVALNAQAELQRAIDNLKAHCAD